VSKLVVILRNVSFGSRRNIQDGLAKNMIRQHKAL